MALFNKKNCDICGQKIGLLGNRKLEDGNLCKDCAKKLSPWFTGRRHSTLNEIKQQLQLREQNMQAVRSFNITKELGNGYNKLFIDQRSMKFAVCGSSDFEKKNPDIIDMRCVTGCKTMQEELRSEKTYTDSEGKQVSYNPPQYDYGYDFFCELTLNHPYIDEIKFKINNSEISRDNNLMVNDFSRKMNECQSICQEINSIFGGQSVGMGGYGNPSNAYMNQNNFATGSGVAGAAMAGFMNAVAGAAQMQNNQNFGGQNNFGNQNAFGGQNSFGNQNNFGAQNNFGGQNGYGMQNNMGGAMAGAGMGTGEIDIPMTPMFYHTVDRASDMSFTVDFNVFGKASYRIVDQLQYNNAIGVNFSDMVIMYLRLAYTAMEQAGVEAMSLMERSADIKNQFIAECRNAGMSVKYGIEIVDAFINMEFTPSAKEMLRKSAQMAEQKRMMADPALVAGAMAAQANNMMQGQNMSSQSMGAQSMGGQWECPNCGGINSGKFCQNCGTPRQ